MKYLCLTLLIAITFFSCRKGTEKQNKEDNPYYNMAFDYREKGMSDSAYLYFTKAKDLFLEKKDSLGAGKCLVNMSMIGIDKGDYFGAQEMSLSAIQYFDEQKKEQFAYISSNYNNLGNSSKSISDFERAIKFYNLSIKFSVDSISTLVNHNNKAVVYKEMKDYPSAIKIYDSIIHKTGGNQIEYARILNNRAYTKWLQNPAYHVIPEYLKALHIRELNKNLWGQNASYTHLAEFYGNKNLDSALFYANRRYQVATVIRSPDDQLSALTDLIKFSPATQAKIYFIKHHHLNDSLQTARWNNKNQFALIRYETEKHKADALKAQRENDQKRSRLQIVYFIVFALIMSLLSVYLWFRKRNRLLQQEKELEVKNTELRYVKKIHDRVANKVYHLMSEVENTPGINRNLIVDKLEALYDISRDISYDSPEPTTEGRTAAEISAMLQSYSSASTEVLIVGNEEEIWEGIPEISKTELFLVMQELMTNMKKHSRAQRVVIKFQRNDNCITVLYADNGVGLNNAAKRNGLQNTENRINHIRGTITFESILEEGLEINISFPAD